MSYKWIIIGWAKKFTLPEICCLDKQTYSDLTRSITKANNAEQLRLAEGIYLPKEENCEDLAQCWPILPLIIDY